MEKQEPMLKTLFLYLILGPEAEIWILVLSFIERKYLEKDKPRHFV